MGDFSGFFRHFIILANLSSPSTMLMPITFEQLTGLFNNYVTPRGVGSSHRDRPISMLVLHVFRDSNRDARDGWFKNGNCSVT